MPYGSKVGLPEPRIILGFVEQEKEPQSSVKPVNWKPFALQAGLL